MYTRTLSGALAAAVCAACARARVGQATHVMASSPRATNDMRAGVLRSLPAFNARANRANRARWTARRSLAPHHPAQQLGRDQRSGCLFGTYGARFVPGAVGHQTLEGLLDRGPFRQQGGDVKQ